MNAYIFQFDLLSGRCTWECTRAGHPAAKKEGPEIPRNRSSLRCGCEWKVYARRVHPNLDESEWKIVSAKLDHTNGCSPCAEQQLLAERARGLFGVLLLKHLYVLPYAQALFILKISLCSCCARCNHLAYYTLGVIILHIIP